MINDVVDQANQTSKQGYGGVWVLLQGAILPWRGGGSGQAILQTIAPKRSKCGANTP